jgi:hypothetical protein
MFETIFELISRARRILIDIFVIPFKKPFLIMGELQPKAERLLA